MAGRFYWGCLTALLSIALLDCVARAADSTPEEARALAAEKDVTQGALRIIQPDGGVVECPLKHTDVSADVAGFIARVRVTQTFHNPTKEKIEAVYVFPLPHEAAVDEMTMVLGERKIVGLIKRRAEARSIYQAALAAGQTAALLEQERPNIFTQSVGNIEPGQEVKVEIAYVDVLKYDLGSYEFRFPMVVGPRYIPGTPSGGAAATPPELAGKVSPPVPDTDRVPDASKISPPVLKPGVRSGHDISLAIKLNAGVPIQNLTHPNHKAEVGRDGDRAAAVKLSAADSIPNKDFVLRYDVVGKKPEMAVLGHTGDYSGDRHKLGNGYFMLMIQPQEDERLTKSPPREIVFLVDVSGSMNGEPTAKVVEAMQGMLKLCRPQDTIQVITFASQAFKLFDKPVPVNEENIGKALGFTAGLQGRGGTEMIKGVRLAIDEPIDKERLRIVVMLTDGYIGNEAEIIEHVGKHCGDQIRFWCVGIGSSPNMFLVDGVAKQGGGMGKSLGLTDQSQPLVQEIMTRIQRAQLAKIRIDWGGLKVSETFPAKIPELWAGRPIIVYGRYSQPEVVDEAGIVVQIKVHGNVEGEDVSWPLRVELPLAQKANDVLAKVWARQKIEDLMQQSYYHSSPAVEEMVTGLALDYRLMSQYTSFVAVDDKQPPSAEPAKPPRQMLVPVPLPEGTRWEGFFGERDDLHLDRFDFAYRRKEADKKELAELSKATLALAPISESRALRDGLARQRRYAAPMAGPVSAAGTAPARNLSLGKAGAFGGYAGVTDARFKQQSLARGGRGLTLGFAVNRPAPGLVNGREVLESLADSLGGEGEVSYADAALAATGAKSLELARQTFAQATGKEAPADRTALARLLTRAYLLDAAAAYAAQSDGSIASQALAKLDELHGQDVKEWSAGLPQLGIRVDLVIRDASLADALGKLAAAAKIDIRLAEGALADSTAITGGPSPRVSYLDLRRASVAEALDWILQPARLRWRPEGKSIVATSARRESGQSSWIYDVSAISLPLEEDLAKLNDYNKAVAESQKGADEFAAAIRAALKASDDQVVWFGPGQLLVFAAPEAHAAMATAVASLEAGQAAPAEPLKTLAAVTRQRFAARKEKLAKADAARHTIDLALAHDHFSWQLLSEATGGKLDLEALTELQIAWKNDDSARLLEGPAKPLMLRSLWAVCESARAMPGEKELAALAEAARQRADAALAKTPRPDAKAQTDAAAIVSALYLGLASPADSVHRARLGQLLTSVTEDPAELAELRLLGRVLIGAASDADRMALPKLIAREAAGPDHVVLLALACQKAGPATWEQFRGAARDMLGSQPLPGEVIVLINRLAPPGARLAAK